MWIPEGRRRKSYRDLVRFLELWSLEHVWTSSEDKGQATELCTSYHQERGMMFGNHLWNLKISYITLGNPPITHLLGDSDSHKFWVGPEQKNNSVAGSDCSMLIPTTWVIWSSTSNSARNTCSRKGHCVESQVNLSSGGTVVLEWGNAICIRKLFTIPKGAHGPLLGSDGNWVPNYGISGDYVTSTTLHEQGFITAIN